MAIEVAQTPKTIHLQGEFHYEEGVAGETISPGHLIESYNSAGTELLRKHAVEAGFGITAVAVEDPLQGKTSTSTQNRSIADDYVVTERVSYHVPVPGAVYYMWLSGTQLTNYVKGDQLQSAGDGTLEKVAGSEKKVFAILLEAKDQSLTAAVAVRAQVRIV
jgi:hypothetical protein